MNIIYGLTIILMIILYILIYKTDKKQNILKWIGISIIILLCYNIFICVIMSFIKIPSTIMNLFIINTIINIILGVKICKDKKIQKYYIDKTDIIAVIVMGIITIITVIKHYGIPINISNTISDATVHYFVSDEFYNNSMLLFYGNSDVLDLWKVDFLMPGAYINTGIIFKIFSGIISETYFCQLFFVFDITIWYLSGILMYILLKNKNENRKILAIVFSIIYMIAWPLNSLISGFSYLSLALNIIITLLIINKEKINKYHKLILIFLTNFGLMFTYYFFAPVVYFAIFLQILLKTNNKKEKVMKIFFSLILPGCFGIVYFVIFQIIKFGANPVEGYSKVLGIEGKIYKNVITNIIIYLVLSIYYIICSIKNKTNKLSNKMFILNVIFMILLFIGMKLGKVSEYYYYKLYYFMWILLIYTSYKGINKLIEKNVKIKILIYIMITIYYIGIICSIITEQKILIFDIFKENSKIVKEENILISFDELEVLDYYNTNINIDKLKNNTYMPVSKIEYGREIWIYAITKNPYNLIDTLFGEVFTNLQPYIESNKKYCVIFEKDCYENYNQIEKEIEKSNIKILFRNEAGMVLEKN